MWQYQFDFNEAVYNLTFNAIISYVWYCITLFVESVKDKSIQSINVMLVTGENRSTRAETCHPQHIPHGLAQNRTWVPAIHGQRPIPSAMAWPCITHSRIRCTKYYGRG